MGLETYLKMIIALHSKFKFKPRPSLWSLSDISVQNMNNRNIFYNNIREISFNKSANDAIYLSETLKFLNLNVKRLHHNGYLKKKVSVTTML